MSFQVTGHRRPCGLEEDLSWNLSTNQVSSSVSCAIPVSGAKSEMVKSKLPNAMLGKIWKLADVDMDGKLDADEFALAMHLIDIKLDGHELPAVLPSHLVPPSKMSNGN